MQLKRESCKEQNQLYTDYMAEIKFFILPHTIQMTELHVSCKGERFSEHAGTFVDIESLFTAITKSRNIKSS